MSKIIEVINNLDNLLALKSATMDDVENVEITFSRRI